MASIERVGRRRGWAALAGLMALSCFGSNDCESETIEHPPAWECSEEALAQLRADDAAALASYERGLADASDPSTAVMTPKSCEAVASSVRSTLRDAMKEMLRSERLMLLRDKCLPRTEVRSHGACGEVNYDDGYAGTVVEPPPNEGAADSSSTNRQVAGVDEADFVKNDARFVYTIARQPSDAVPAAGELVILDVWPAEQAHEVSRIALEGYPHRLHLEGDRLLVYASLPEDAEDKAIVLDPFWGQGSPDCTYGYDCVPLGDGLRTLVTVYDVSDRSAPVEERRLVLSGSYVNSRRVEDVVYTLVHEPTRLLRGLRTTPAVQPESPEEALAAFAALEAENDERLEHATVEELLPSIAVSSAAGEAEHVDCGTVFEASTSGTKSFLSVVSLSITDDGAAPRNAKIYSDPGFTYASPKALYVAVPPSDPWGYAEPDRQSSIHEFDLDGLAVSYAASGTVPGRVLNQFSMDEFEGFLRVASTTGYSPMPDAESTLSVLERAGAELVTVGKVSHIAPGEDIRSVRFADERGYVVTFRNTDPLFVFDLSKPKAPRLAGELEIPGFSSYIHPLDDSHLLSIGYDATETGELQGIKLQVFDVADMSNPRLLHKATIGTYGSRSEALENHLGFTYFAPKNWLALPVTICDAAIGQPALTTFSGLQLYDVSLATGFDLLGAVAYPMPEGGEAYCGWWTESSSLVERSIVLEDYVLSLSAAELKVNHASDLGTDVAVLPLGR